MAPIPDRPSGQHEVDRRGLVLALPVGLIALVTGSVADSFLSPVGRAGLRVVDLADRMVDDLLASSASTAATTPRLQALERAVVGAIGGRSNVVGVSVHDRRSGVLWHYRGGRLVRTGSVAKAMVAAQAIRVVRAQGRWLSATEQDWARLAITRSDNASADALYAFIGGHDGVAALAADLGMTETAAAERVDHWGLTLTTPNDLVRLMRALTEGHPALHRDDRAYLLGLMAQVADGQRWGVGTVEAPDVGVRLKNGWMLVDTPWVINSFGDVRGEGRDYVLAIMQRAQPDERTGVVRASRISRAVFAALEDPLT
ncbi:hypothetical protein N865_03875 [Intrasporangium oryzae NRRL B-24470]|uniref:Beta-lactamase class A catalytic domain-containing protein n=1 Tax=Intrasporangium oryzae NRRL B-24470 TaxID=1386089 RepID=W9GCX3_9MICO|nr:serine hydrolase [Intrasporangium oryzae]EWT03062.1 hypothetical protein N865_03875 [Intrasporangium oryzae NRRL B-24470]